MGIAMTRYTNHTGIPISVAVFLATDTYSAPQDMYTISATTLLKPVRQVVLASRLPDVQRTVDIASLVQSQLGRAIHDAIEQAWRTNYRQALAALGYPAGMIERVRINPEPHELTPDCIPVYVEQRVQKRLGKWTITGQFDFVGDGRLEDHKSTSVWTWINNNKDRDYIYQGSIYRWLNPEKITRDEMAIQFVFTDWSAAQARSLERYPPARTLEHRLRLLPLLTIEQWIRQKLALLEASWGLPEDQLPQCTDEELWRRGTVWKYYKNPNNTTKSTKNYDNRAEANLRRAKDGGVVREVQGKAMACRYCPAFPLCSQARLLQAAGDLEI